MIGQRLNRINQGLSLNSPNLVRFFKMEAAWNIPQTDKKRYNLSQHPVPSSLPEISLFYSDFVL